MNVIELLSKRKRLRDELVKVEILLEKKKKRIGGNVCSIISQEDEFCLLVEDLDCDCRIFIPFKELKGMCKYLDSLTSDKIVLWKRELRRFDKALIAKYFDDDNKTPLGLKGNGLGEADEEESEHTANFCPRYKDYFQFSVFADMPTLYLELKTSKDSMWISLKDIKKWSKFLKGVLHESDMS